MIRSTFLSISLLSLSYLANASGPVAMPDSFVSYINSPISISVLSLTNNDNVPEGAVIDVNYIDDAEFGEVSYDQQTGVIHFQPHEDFIGTASFVYGIIDQEARQSWSRVSIDVTNDINEVPLVIHPTDDTFLLSSDSLTIEESDLLSNDTNKPQELTIAYIDDWQGGIVRRNQSGSSLTFEPNEGFAGTASFTYGFKVSSTPNSDMTYAKVHIQVAGEADSLVVVDDTLTTQVGVPLFIDGDSLLANDTGSVGQLSIVDFHEPINGTFEQAAEIGDVIFTPNPEFVGEASLSYTIQDEANRQASGMIRITVNGQDSLPSQPIYNTGASLKLTEALGGKSLMGMNLTGEVYYTAADIYKDKMRAADPWKTSDANGTRFENDIYFDQIPKRSDGYPTYVPFSVVGTDLPQTVVMPISSGERRNAGNYHVLFEGQGEFNLFGARLIEEVSAGHHIYKFGDEVFLGIEQSAVEDPLHGFVMVHEDDFSSYENQPFNERLPASLDDISVVRLMDMMFTNGNAAIDASHLTPQRYYTWNDCPGSVCNGGAFAGHPPATLMALVNHLDVHPWVTLPHRADDDYIRAYAELVLSNLDEDKFVFVEYSNELWNWMFPQTTWLEQAACEDPITRIEFDDPELPMGECNVEVSARRLQTKRSLEIFTIFKDVFGDQSHRIITILSGQGSWIYRTEQSLLALDDERINPNDQTIDALAIAPYFGGYPQIDTQERRDFFVNASFEELQQMAYDDIHHDDVRGSISRHAAMANERGMLLFAYEGGQHYLCGYNESLEYDFCNDSVLMDKLTAFQRHPVMEAIYNEYYKVWFENGGSLFAVFSHMGSATSKFGAWGTLEYHGQPLDDAPKRRALIRASQDYRLPSPETP
jgi:hypothetical protein